MPITTTEVESRRILAKKADAITRVVRGGNTPYSPGQRETLWLTNPKSGDLVKYANVTIKTVRPCTLDERIDGPQAEALAEGEGFGHPTSWEKNLNELYGGAISGDSELVRVRFDVDSLVDG